PLGRLEVVGGPYKAFVTADVISSMTIGNRVTAAIERSAIWATRRIDGAVIVGDIVNSEIRASPVAVEDFGDGPMVGSQSNRLVRRLTAAVVVVGNHLE